ncbi:hypothetical protein J6P92_06505 [bacterium]|nr:hypothetical protein [bacterium]
MDISLSPGNEQFLQNKIAEGIYKSINEAINATLNIAISGSCIRQERLDMLNADLQKGVEDYNEGRYSEGTEFFDELIEEYEQL